jgi:hypothetical protein
VLGVGIPFMGKPRQEQFHAEMQRLTDQVSGVRRLGAGAVDMAYVACGRFDAYWEQSVSAWDMAAGAVIVREAGGVVTDTLGRPLDLMNGTVLAVTPQLQTELLARAAARRTALKFRISGSCNGPPEAGLGSSIPHAPKDANPMLDLVTITPEEFADLRASLPAITDRYLFDVFGISEFTWVKLRKGLPVKRITLERALAKRERWRAMGGSRRAGPPSPAERPLGDPLQGHARRTPPWSMRLRVSITASAHRHAANAHRRPA